MSFFLDILGLEEQRANCESALQITGQMALTFGERYGVKIQIGELVTMQTDTVETEELLRKSKLENRGFRVEEEVDKAMEKVAEGIVKDS